MTGLMMDKHFKIRDKFLTIDEYIKLVKNFCKRTRIKDEKLQNLFKIFVNDHPDYKDQGIFETTMLSLRKTPAIVCRDKCIKYARDEGKDKWMDYASLVEYVSKEFWDEVVKDIEDPKEIPEPETPPVKSKVYLSKIPALRKSSNLMTYHRLLPADWAIKTFSEKIDFTIKVQHKGFLNFILDSDKKIKEYYSKLVDKRDPKLKLYITLFTVPAGRYCLESKELLRSFVDALNQLGRAKLQYLECTNPDMIEIREIR
jgi:hypothetical protein